MAEIYCRNSSNAPDTTPAPAPDPEVPELFAYDHVEFVGNFVFARENEAAILEKYLEQLQRWIYLNNFRPLACLKALPFFQQQTVKRISQNILLELFSVDRDTRLKTLLSDMYINVYNVEDRIVTKAVVVIILTYFDIPLMETENDDENMFSAVFSVLLSALHSSSNLFLCDFMLHHLTSSGIANDIISKHDLNTLLKIDTSIEDTHLANFLNKEFMQPVERKRTGFINTILCGRQKNVNLALFKDRAETILKDIRYFQTILTNLPDNNGDDDNDDGNNNNDGGNDGNSDEEDEIDRRIRERFERIRRRSGAVADEEFELNPVGEERDIPEQPTRPQVERRLSWPLAKSGSKILLKLVDNRGSVIFDERRVMQVLREDYNELVNNPDHPITSAAIISSFHGNPSIRNSADALISGTVPLTSIRYRSSSVRDQIDFNEYGHPPSRESSFVANSDFIPSPVSDNARQDEVDQNVPVSGDVPSPVSEVNDHEEIRSMVSGDDESEPSSDHMSLNEESNASLNMTTDSIERLVDDITNRGAAVSDSASTDSQLAPLDEVVKNWMDRNILAGETEISRVVDIEEEERLEFLGIDYYDREGFGHYFVNLPQATFVRLLELRNKMDVIKQAFRNLTSDRYVNPFHRQVLLGDMLPEGVDILEEVQQAYKEMAAQYVNYQRSAEEFERGYALLRMLEFVNGYIPRIMLLINQFRPGSELHRPDIEGIYGTLCDGTQAAASLKLTWEMYVESSSAFKKIQGTYQDSIDNLEQEFLLAIDEFHRQSAAYLDTLGTEEDQRG